MLSCLCYFLPFAIMLLLSSTSFVPFYFSPFLYFLLIFSSFPPCCLFLSSRPSYLRPLSLIILTLFFSFLFCLTTQLKYTAHICWQSSSITARFWKACSSQYIASSRNTVRNKFMWTRKIPQCWNHTYTDVDFHYVYLRPDKFSDKGRCVSILLFKFSLYLYYEFKRI